MAVWHLRAMEIAPPPYPFFDEAPMVRDLVRRLAEAAAPGDEALAERAVRQAMDAHLSGASAAEACEVGKSVIAAQG